MVAEQVQLPAVTEMIVAAMDKKEMDIKGLSRALDITYEHARRIARGESIPSKFILKSVASTLDLDVKELERLSKIGTITRKFGEVPAMMAGKKPGMEPLERAWDSLTDEQKHDLVQMATTWAKRNRSVKV